MAQITVNMGYRRTSVSLQKRLIAGATRIAADDAHGNFSRVIQDLLEAELRCRYGRDWASDSEIAQIMDGSVETAGAAA